MDHNLLYGDVCARWTFSRATARSVLRWTLGSSTHPRNSNTLRDHVGYHPEIIRMVADKTTLLHGVCPLCATRRPCRARSRRPRRSAQVGRCPLLL